MLYRSARGEASTRALYDRRRRCGAPAPPCFVCVYLYLLYIMLCCRGSKPSGYIRARSVYIYIYNGLALLPFIPLVRFLLIPKVSCYHHRPLLKLADFSMETFFFPFQTAPPPPIVIEHNTYTHTRVFRYVLEQLITYYTYINYNTCRKRQNALVR